MQDEGLSNSTIRLLQHPLSPYAQKIMILLREKGLPFEAVTPSFGGEGGASTRPGDVNPRGEIPVLLHGTETIYDSTIILEYLEETYPTPAMMPEGPAARARVRLIEEICDTHWEAINWGLGEIKFFNRGGEALGPVLRASAEADAANLYAWLEGVLGDAPWLTGAQFGWGDLAALPYATMTEMFGIAPPSGSRVEAWMKRALERPAVATTIVEARASTTGMDGGERLLKAGVFRRQFRDHRLEWMIRSGGLQVVLDGLDNNDIRFTDLASFAARARP